MKIVARVSLGSIVAVVGCHTGAPPPRVAVPASYNEGGAVMTYPRLKPLPAPYREGVDNRQDMNASGPTAMGGALPQLTIDDPPLITQAPPEQPAYLDAYARVGKPRVGIFVNRLIEGKVIGSDDRYLERGQYDDAQANAIDYGAIELVLTDLLAANGRVTIVDPTMVRQRLTDDEVKDLQAGRPQALREVAEKLDVDVLIQAQARPTRQTAQGLAIRVLVQAFNTKGGESIARAFVDVPPPLEKPTINRFTRFLARKTMYELTGTWSSMNNDTDRRPAQAPAQPSAQPLPQPTTQP